MRHMALVSSTFALQRTEYNYVKRMGFYIDSKQNNGSLLVCLNILLVSNLSSSVKLLKRVPITCRSLPNVYPWPSDLHAYLTSSRATRAYIACHCHYQLNRCFQRAWPSPKCVFTVKNKGPDFVVTR